MINCIEIPIVDHCNLKCKGCSSFSSIARPNFKSLDDYYTEIAQLSRVTDRQVQAINISGGEPLMHPEVTDFCLMTRQFFPETQICLVTNGILLRKLTDENINMLNKARIGLWVNAYGNEINMNKYNKFDAKALIEQNSLYNISLDLTGQQKPNLSFGHCDIKNQYCLKDGYIYQCRIMANIEHFCSQFKKDFDINLNDIRISIFDHSIEEIEQFLNTPHTVCRYCDIQSRIQSYQNFEITKKDIKEWTN